MESPHWIDEMFLDATGFLRQYENIVRLLVDRERNILSKMIGQGLTREQADSIAVPSKPKIAKTTGYSLAHVQNVHRVMKEAMTRKATDQF